MLFLFYSVSSSFPVPNILVSISPQQPSMKDGLAAGTVARLLGEEPGRNKRFISASKHPDRLLGTPIPF
jgi:hypothetical protein